MPDDDKKLTVQELAAENPVAAALSFSELDEAVANGDVDAEDAYPSRYAVEDNDLSNFKGVSEEYRTYASEVDSPLDWDASVADNSVEKLEALADDGNEQAKSMVESLHVDSSVDSDDDDVNDEAKHRTRAAKKAAAKKSQPPIHQAPAQNDDENK